MVVGLILAIEFLAMWAGHFTPWYIIKPLCDKTGQLHRLLAYSYGVFFIGAGLVLFVIDGEMNGSLVNSISVAQFLLADIVAAATGTILPRLLKQVGEKKALEKDVRAIKNRIGNP